MSDSPTPPRLNFQQSITTCFRKYADFSGRAARGEFWWFILFTGLVAAALGALNSLSPEGGALVGSALSSIWGIGVLLPTLAVMVRRLNDLGRPWQEVFWLLVPIAGLIVLAINLSRSPASTRV